MIAKLLLATLTGNSAIGRQMNAWSGIKRAAPGLMLDSSRDRRSAKEEREPNGH
jgi:hypothetical protein